MHRKEININPEHIGPLTIEGIKKGFANLKSYLEHLVDEAGKKAVAKNK